MALGLSLFSTTVGALLALTAHVSAVGINIDALGLVLLVAGAVWTAVSLLFWPDADDRPRPGRRLRTFEHDLR